jgi:dGTPase
MRYRRRHDSRIKPPSIDPRSEARRDRDRIIYSIEFQRLVGVTQVVSPTERFPVHNRLTHSLKVAQVGRSIAEQLLYRYRESGIGQHLDPDVVDAACLAHDLGHPPFGHNTERELDSLLREPGSPPGVVDDGFEGNAQSFRVVTTTAIRYQEVEQKPGLNLTAATLNALLKYPWGQRENRDRRRKWGYYQSERADFNFARTECGFPLDSERRSLEAAIMNLADDISYAVHDVEDFVRAGLIPTAVFTRESNEQAWFQAKCAEIAQGLSTDDVAQVLGFVNLFRYKGRHTDQAMLSEFRSESVNHFITSLRIKLTEHGPEVDIPADVRTEIDVLQLLTRIYVIDSPAVQSQRYGQRRMIREVFNVFLAEATTPDSPSHQRSQLLRIFPPLWQERIEVVPPDEVLVIKRLIADLIASMTEQQVCDTFEKLTGRGQASAVEPIA